MEQCQVSFGGIISRRVDHNTCETPRLCSARHASIMLRHSRYQRFRSPTKEFSPKGWGEVSGELHYRTGGASKWHQDNGGKDVDEGLSTLDAVSSRYRANWGLWRDCRGHPPSAAQLASCCASSMTVEATTRKSPLSV